ncbi:MAG: DUF3791 domain-containing protein [Muribaculaceae bacterium]|nr:DUF3791 domain-containing protein [Muribaculaceae bacterium]
MKEEVDKLTGETWIKLSKEEVKFGFLAQCIEALAEAENCDYIDLLNRLESVDMTEGYILAHYDVLHTESIENIIYDLKELLHKRESEKCA